jgi:hypothetical protein
MENRLTANNNVRKFGILQFGVAYYQTRLSLFALTKHANSRTDYAQFCSG